MTSPIGSVYLRAFFNVVVAAVDPMPYAPADYAASSAFTTKKSLALVNAGVSLELAVPLLESQTFSASQLRSKCRSFIVLRIPSQDRQS